MLTWKMFRRCFLFFILCAIFPAASSAGQLHVQWYGLADVARNGFAVLGTVVEVDLSKKRLKFLAKKVYIKSGNEPKFNIYEERVAEKTDDFYKKGEVYNISRSEGLREGQEYELEIYQGVVWDNPRKSPLDERVIGYLSLNNLKKGQEVVVVFPPMPNYEVIAADGNTLRKLDLFFDADEVVVNGKVMIEAKPDDSSDQEKPRKNTQIVYGKNESLEQLIRDFGDFDLSDMAREALKARRAFTANAVLTAAVEGNLHSYRNILSDHYESLNETSKKAFIAEAVGELEARPDTRKIGALLDHLTYHTPEDIHGKEKGAILILWMNHVRPKEQKGDIPSDLKRLFKFLPKETRYILDSESNEDIFNDLVSKDKNVREKAYDIIKRLSPERNRRLLKRMIEALRQKYLNLDQVIFKTSFAAVAVQVPEAVPNLVEFLEDPKTSSEGREAVAKLLREIGGPEARAALKRYDRR